MVAQLGHAIAWSLAGLGMSLSLGVCTSVSVWLLIHVADNTATSAEDAPGVWIILAVSAAVAVALTLMWSRVQFARSLHGLRLLVALHVLSMITTMLGILLNASNLASSYQLAVCAMAASYLGVAAATHLAHFTATQEYRQDTDVAPGLLGILVLYPSANAVILLTIAALYLLAGSVNHAMTLSERIADLAGVLLATLFLSVPTAQRIAHRPLLRSRILRGHLAYAAWVWLTTWCVGAIPRSGTRARAVRRNMLIAEVVVSLALLVQVGVMWRYRRRSGRSRSMRSASQHKLRSSMSSIELDIGQHIHETPSAPPL